MSAYCDAPLAETWADLAKAQEWDLDGLGNRRESKNCIEDLMNYKRVLKYSIWIASPAIIISFCWVVLLTLRLTFTDGLESKRGTYAYYVTISSPTIRHVPIIKPAGEPVYSSSPGGLGPPWEDVEYVSYEKKDAIVVIIADYLKKEGYTDMKSRGYYGGMLFKKKKNELELVARNKTDNTTEVQVIVSFWEFK